VVFRLGGLAERGGGVDSRLGEPAGQVAGVRGGIDPAAERGRYPFDVTNTRRHDGYRTTGRTGTTCLASFRITS
jgi:hypothetical protein